MACPDPAGSYTTPDGVVIPMGKGIDSAVGQSSLLYNEYPFMTFICLTFIFRMCGVRGPKKPMKVTHSSPFSDDEICVAKAHP